MSYVYYDVGKDKERVKEMMKKSGQLGIPVILVNDQVLVGFNELIFEELLSK
ncbi:glutaredoxin family protein [Chloroflexota bacterium]